MEKMASPAPVGTLSFGLSCLVVGALFAGWFGPMSNGNMFVGAICSLSSGLLLLVVTILSINKNAVAGSPLFSTWVGTIFGFFAQSWIILGIILLFWRNGVAQPLSFLMIFLFFICMGYAVYAVKLNAKSFVIVFTIATISCLLAFFGLYRNWTLGSTLSGYGFMMLAALTLYIAFWEQLAEVLPGHQTE